MWPCVSHNSFNKKYTLFPIDTPELHCYVHSVSPLKKSGHTSYIICTLQTKSKVHRGVCFATSKQETLEAMEKQKSPVKIKNFTINNKYGTEDVVIDKNTTITPITADFEYHSQEKVLSISSLTNVAPEQLVAIKGYLAHLSATKKIIVQRSELKKQEGYIADPSGSTKIIFWGNHTDEVQQGSTYFFNKVRVKISQDQKYLNTPKQESECIIKSAEPFKETLPVVDEVSTSKEVIGSIIGISKVNKYSSCCTCAKKVTIKGKLAYCERCKMTQKLSACRVQWSFKIVVHTEDNPRQKINLNIYGQQMVQKLFTICEITETASEDEAEVAILNTELFKFSFDTQSHKVIDIDPIHI